MHYCHPEVGGGGEDSVCPELHRISGGKCHGGSICVLHMIQTPQQFIYQPKYDARQMGFIQISTTLSKCLGSPNGEHSVAIMHFYYGQVLAVVGRRNACSGKGNLCRTLDPKRGAFVPVWAYTPNFTAYVS